jgi:hypothetical protein
MMAEEKPKEEEKGINERIDESYGYEPEEKPEEEKSIAQTLMEAIKTKRDNADKKSRSII